MQNYLESERPLAEIEGKAAELRALAKTSEEMNVENEASALDKKAGDLLINLYENLTKKETQMLNREKVKLSDQHRGIKDMRKPPDAVVVVDSQYEATAIKEATSMNIPTVAIVDSNTDPNKIDFPIPANDDSLRTIQLIVGCIADSILEINGANKDKKEDVEDKTSNSNPKIAPPANAKSEEEEFMAIDAKTVKQLRDKTGAGMMDCKNALTESNGDLDGAVDHLRKSGAAKAEKKGERETKEGLVYSYIHAGGRLGVMIEVNCETDFVAKTDGFIELAHNLAMQIAATNPISLDKDSVSIDVVAKEKEIYTDQAKSSGKPDNIIEKMVEGRLSKFYQENCLMEQAYIKDSDKKVVDLMTETIATLGENITISQFTRFAVGESNPQN